MATVTADQMQDKLLTLDQLRETLSTTEPIASTGFPVGNSVEFDLGQDWNAAGDALKGDQSVNARMKLGAAEYQLTKDSLLEATSICGIPKGYASRTPAALIQDQLNYWFRGGLGDKEYKAITVEDRAVALTRSTIQPFPNLRFLDDILEVIHNRYGYAARLTAMVDYKLTHSLQRTHFRLIIPERSLVVPGTGVENDQWSLGLQFKNSLIGLEQTALDGYLFRWTCTNGAIDNLATSGTWSRRGGQGDEVYEWARAAVDDVLGGLEGSLDAIQELPKVSISGDVNLVMRDLFAQFQVPLRVRDSVIAAMVETDDLTLYSLQAAITQAANSDQLTPGAVEQLMRAGGHITHAVTGRCHECRRLLPQD